MRTIKCPKCEGEIINIIEDEEALDINTFNITCSCKYLFKESVMVGAKFGRADNYWFEFLNEKNITIYKNKVKNA